MKLIEQILSAAQTNPNKIAVSEKDQTFTYHELFDAVQSIAADLEQNAKDHRPVLVFGKNDFITLAAMLAANLTGRAYIPIDAHTPFERTQMIYNSANPSVSIITTKLTDKFNDLFTNKVIINKFIKHFRFNLDMIDTKLAISGDATNYIIYTSGTTGAPKGVAVSHNNLQTFVNWMNNDFRQIKNNQILEQALYSFDLSIFSLYPSLTTGGTLISLSHEETTNFKLLFERLNSTQINTWISTPSFVDICLLDPSFVAAKHPQLLQFIFCGEELTHRTAERLLKAFPDATIYNTYGPTEATGAISSIRITSELLEKYSRVPIGFAKPGVSIKIIDNEIIIIGDSVAKGYFENAERTTQAFFSLDGRHAYHTGDAGFIDENGILNYNGRIDFQVKFNGFRIELQDIEANLLKLPQVEKALVLPKENEAHKVIALIAVLVVNEKKPDHNFTRQLKRDLASNIMDYMMPTKFVYLTDFPLNQNGKVDRKRLINKVYGGK